MTQTDDERQEMHALAVSDAKLAWETEDGVLEGRFTEGILRWPAGDKERAELLLNVDCEDATYEVKLRYSSVQRRFIGTWAASEDKGTAWCVISRETIGDDVELKGEWTENGHPFSWSGLLTLNEEFKDE